MIDFNLIKELSIAERNVVKIENEIGQVIWAKNVQQDSTTILLEVEKQTYTTYAGETTYENEEFILLDIYPQNANSIIKVTYGGLTKTLAFEGTNAQKVYFGTFNGVSDSVTTLARGILKIEGECSGFAVGSFSSSPKLTNHCACITNVIDWGMVKELKINAFYKCNKLTSVELPSEITIIGYGAFFGCSSLTSITIPDSVTSIGGSAFDSCTSLTFIKIPDSVTSIEYSTFAGCESLTSVVMPNSITSISDQAFDGCSSLVLDSLPSALTSIGMEAFNGCLSLALTSLPSGITTIGESAFYSCENMTISELPSGLTVIEQGAFQACRKITVKSLPSGVTSIGGWGFQGCRAIPSMIIPSGVTSIGKNAFNACNALSSVTFENTFGWYVTETADATSGTNVDVTNPTTNVTLLKTTYGTGYYWYRS